MVALTALEQFAGQQAWKEMLVASSDTLHTIRCYYKVEDLVITSSTAVDASDFCINSAVNSKFHLDIDGTCIRGRKCTAIS